MAASALEAIGDARPRSATKAVIGPGTGLGMGVLQVRRDGYRALPSEGGHGDLATTNPLEHEVYSQLSALVPFVSWEAALSPAVQPLPGSVCGVGV
ncbi:MAG: hypothetical protein HC809_07485 [Gammaproteobacteria bacterium]|nr:hypothetical protein [Gammaproteobacteria bacterium]